MSSSAKQLSADYELIKELLERYPAITLLATEGDPPARYDLEYNIKGYKAGSDGTPSPANRHAVRINLPFGYPHFPPTAKPLTPIFHPDIDPDAIRIADFWQKNKSLPELIIHIGQMICGTFYSEQESFNQQAFDWYEERKSWMPFDILESRDADEEDDEQYAQGQTDSAPLDEHRDDIMAELPDMQENDDEGTILFDLGDVVEDPVGDREDSVDLISLAAENEEDGDILFELELEEDSVSREDDQDAMSDWTAIQDEDLSFSFAAEEDAAADPAGRKEEEIELDFDLAEEDPQSAGESLEIGGSGADELTETFGLGAEPDDSPADMDEESGPDEDSIDFGSIEESMSLDDDEKDSLPEKDPDEENSLASMGLQLDDSPTRTASGAVQNIRSLIDRKEIFGARNMLASVPDVAASAGELGQTVEEAVSEAEELYKKADQFEQKGMLEKAGLMLDLIANIATDYPGLELARNRIRESMMAGSGGKEIKRDQESGKEQDQLSAPDREKRKPAADMRGGKKKKKKFSSLSLIPFKIIAAILIIGGLGSGVTMSYFKDQQNYHLALANLKQAEMQVDNREYRDAQQLLDNARAAAEALLIFRRGEKKTIARQINTILTDQAFQEGLQGRVLYDEHYVSVETARANDKFKSHMDIARSAEQSGRIEQAIASYNKALEYADKSEYLDQQAAIGQKINNLHLELALIHARSAEEEHSWERAADTYQKALELSGNLSSAEEQQDIARRLAAVSLRHEIDESMRAFTASEWERTISMLQRAEEILLASPEIASDNEKEEISRLLVNARLFQYLSEARAQYESLDREKAVATYGKAVELLEENIEVLGKEETADSIRKINKTILMTRIDGMQKLAIAAVNSNDLEAGRRDFAAIAAMIAQSDFRREDELKTVADNALKQTANLEKELTINRRKDWLFENYEEIFRTYYPSAKSSELLNPRVHFIKRDEDSLIFTIDCVEKQQGRSFSLQLNYMYDLKNNSWDLYSGEI